MAAPSQSVKSLEQRLAAIEAGTAGPGTGPLPAGWRIGQVSDYGAAEGHTVVLLNADGTASDTVLENVWATPDPTAEVAVGSNVILVFPDPRVPRILQTGGGSGGGEWAPLVVSTLGFNG